MKQLKALGIPQSMINQSRQLIPSTVPADATTVLGPILDRQFATQLSALASTLETYLTELARHPVR